MSRHAEILIVSGLPRSGTSLMMQMLDRGGIPAVTDEVRAADRDNPRGYFEFERVKQTKRDSSWLPELAEARSSRWYRSCCMICPTPSGIELSSCNANSMKSLNRKKRCSRVWIVPPHRETPCAAAFSLHLERLFAWLPEQEHMRVLRVSYNDLIADPDGHVAQIARFLDDRPSIADMLSAIDPSLYRNRKSADALRATNPMRRGNNA